MSQQSVNFPNRREAERIIQDAMHALRNGLRDQARKLALRSAELDPDNEGSWLILAALSSPNASIQYLQKALQINPNSERARQGMQWGLDRVQKEETQNQFQSIVKNTQPIPTKPTQEQSITLPATVEQNHLPPFHTIPIQEHSLTLPATLVQDPLPQLQAKLFQDNSEYQTEEDLWQIDFTKITDPGKFIFEFILNGFFTAYHQISMPWTGMGVKHNHTFRLQITASAEFVTHDNQVIVSYKSISTVVERICMTYEGKTLNDLPPFKHLQPTTENLVGVIVQQLERLSSGKQYKIYEVTLMESPTVGVVYKNMNVLRTFR